MFLENARYIAFLSPHGFIIERVPREHKVENLGFKMDYSGQEKIIHSQRVVGGCIGKPIRK